jgi:hypothetical protein
MFLVKIKGTHSSATKVISEGISMLVGNVLRTAGTKTFKKTGALLIWQQV